MFTIRLLKKLFYISYLRLFTSNLLLLLSLVKYSPVTCFNCTPTFVRYADAFVIINLSSSSFIRQLTLCVQLMHNLLAIAKFLVVFQMQSDNRGRSVHLRADDGTATESLHAVWRHVSCSGLQQPVACQVRCKPRQIASHI